MTRVHLAYTLGLILLSLPGFLCPIWYVGFIPLGVGLLWATYDLIDTEEAAGGNTSATPRR
jgi:hypothetical protein